MAYIHNEVAYENAIRRNIRNNALKTFCKNPDNNRAYEYLIGVEQPNDFLNNLRNVLNDFGKLTEKQVAAVLRVIDGAAERKAAYAAKNAEIAANSVYLGEVGKSIILELKLKKIIEIQGVPFSYYDSGINYINLFEDELGNVVVYKGKKYICPEGIVVRIKASVKEHKDYNGCKQTVLQRPKVLEEPCLNYL